MLIHFFLIIISFWANRNTFCPLDYILEELFLNIGNVKTTWRNLKYIYKHVIWNKLWETIGSFLQPEDMLTLTQQFCIRVNIRYVFSMCVHQETCAGKPVTSAILEGFWWPSNPTSGHIPRENRNSERHTYPNAHSSSIYSSQDMETTEMPLKRETDKAGVVCVYNGILLSQKKEWNWVIWRDMDGPGEHHTEWS